MAMPIPSPRVANLTQWSTRSVLWLHSLPPPCVQDQRTVRCRGDSGRLVLTWLSATVMAAAESSPQKTRTGVWALSASASSLSVPSSSDVHAVMRQEIRSLVVHSSRATTQPATTNAAVLLERLLRPRVSACVPADRNACGVFVGERHQSVQQQIGNRGLVICLAWGSRAASPTWRTPTLSLSRAPNSAAENVVEIGLTRKIHVE
jgi:hypothetical protein